jgi:hypothetical protein
MPRTSSRPGLNPVLALTKDHSFENACLIEEDFSGVIIDDPQALRNWIQLEELMLVETALLTGANPALFKQAVDAAKLLIGGAAADFELTEGGAIRASAIMEEIGQST